MPFLAPIFAALGSAIGVGTVGAGIGSGLATTGGGLIGALSALGGGSALAGLGTAAGLAGTGTSLANSLSGPPTPTAAPVPTAAQNAATEEATRSANALLAQRQIPGLQEDTGNSLSPDYQNQLASQIAGIAGSNPSTINPGGANWLGLAGASPSSNPGWTGALDQLSGIAA